MKADENKETEQFVDTASSDFYSSPTQSAQKGRDTGVAVPLEALEDQIARTKETLIAAQQLFKRLESNQQLRSYVDETQQELKVVRSRTISEQNAVKSSFEQNFGSLQRELSSFRKNWKEIKEKAEAEMEEEMSLLREKVKQDEGSLGKAFKSTSACLKGKINLVLQQCRETKKQRGDMAGFLMSQIEQARARLEGGVQSQRKKRTEYQEIVLGLLDRTVEQGEKLLRRIC